MTFPIFVDPPKPVRLEAHRNRSPRSEKAHSNRRVVAAISRIGLLTTVLYVYVAIYHMYMYIYIICTYVCIYIYESLLLGWWPSPIWVISHRERMECWSPPFISKYGSREQHGNISITLWLFNIAMENHQVILKFINIKQQQLSNHEHSLSKMVWVTSWLIVTNIYHLSNIS